MLIKKFCLFFFYRHASVDEFKREKKIISTALNWKYLLDREKEKKIWDLIFCFFLLIFLYIDSRERIFHKFRSVDECSKSNWFRGGEKDTKKSTKSITKKLNRRWKRKSNLFPILHCIRQLRFSSSLSHSLRVVPRSGYKSIRGHLILFSRTLSFSLESKWDFVAFKK